MIDKRPVERRVLEKYVPAVGGVALCLLFATPAAAHITLMYPAPRTTEAGQKGPAPCGVLGPRKPNTFRPGQTITVKWLETIGHPGHFRLAFDSDGMDDFKDPTSFTDIQVTPIAPILADGVLKHTNSPGNVMREVQITFPNMTCSTCTLQLLQMMTDKPPFGPGGGDDLYRQCADIVLAGDPTAADGGVPADAGMDVSSGGLGGANGDGGRGGATGTGGTGSGGVAGAAGGATGAGGLVAGGRGGNSGRGGSGGGVATTPRSSDTGGGCSFGGRQASPLWTLLALMFFWMRRRSC